MTAKMEEITFESLILYLTGDGTSEERNRIDIALKTDPGIAIKLKEAELVLNGIRHAGEKEVEEKVKSFHVALRQSGQLDRMGKPTGMIYTLGGLKTLSIAASILLLLFVGYNLFIPGRNDKLFNKYYTADSEYTPIFVERLNRTGMASPDKSQRDALKAIIIKYQNGNHNESVNDLSKHLMTFPGDSLARLYLGLSYLGNEEYSKASRVLQTMTTNSEIAIQDMANWYLSLSYIKNDEIQKAKALLNKIVLKLDSPYQNSAKDLLNSLQ